MTFEKINDKQEEIAKFVYPLYGEIDDLEYEYPVLLTYDYDSVEGINHIISDLDLENKTDEKSLNFLYRLRGRKHHFYSQTEEYKAKREERQKESENITILDGLVSLADILENVEKKTMNLESEFDEYLELHRYCNEDIHADTEELLKKMTVFKLLDWHKKKGHRLSYRELNEAEADTALKEIKGNFWYRTWIKDLKKQYNLIITGDWKILDDKEALLSAMNPNQIEFIESCEELKGLTDEIDEVLKTHEIRLNLLYWHTARRTTAPLPPEMWAEVEKQYHNSLDSEEETSRKLKKFYNEGNLKSPFLCAVKNKKEILMNARVEKLKAIKKSKEFYLKNNGSSLSLLLAKTLKKVWAWKHYKNHLHLEQQTEHDYYELWKQFQVSEQSQKNNEKEPTDEGYHSNTEEEEPQETPPITPPITPPKLLDNTPPLKNLFQQAQFKIKTLLTKYHLKIKDLPKQYQNWEEQLAKLTSEEEINNFLRELEKEISQVAQQQSVSKTQPNQKPFPLWFWLLVGIMIFGWVIVMRRIWQGKRKVKK